MMMTTTTSSSTTTSTLISSYRIAAVWRDVWPNYGVRINISLKISYYNNDYTVSITQLQ